MRTVLPIIVILGAAALPLRAEIREIDFLTAATDFADCMIEYGRDRYGAVHSPLFAVLLTREAEPRIGPQPVFARPCPYDTGTMKTPFRLHHYNRCLNYPSGLGSEGPHKVTFFGCDVYEDSALYTMLIDLTRITGEKKYRAEAEKALRWWFTKTLGPADLYPWGEHLGWDFENECPTYFAGPSRHLYAACYHEIKDRVPFLDFLAAMPAAKLRELARFHPGETGEKKNAGRPPAAVADLSKADTPPPHGRAIIRLVEQYRACGDRKYLRAAEQQARLAYVRFLDDRCPLPKACETPRKAADGTPFPDFYFRGGVRYRLRNPSAIFEYSLQ